ncbi:hypothetical protein ACFY7Z_03880 [Streptomyces sp. NPDC012623]|uniref:hypothetical protein n=1 Tax=unclassified Streptomyces TaxID=2593676 RepID=UPI0036BEE42D
MTRADTSGRGNMSGYGGRAAGGPAAARPASPARPVRLGRLARLVRLTGVLALAVLAPACGIRTTSIPVDAGAAPSRMPCEISDENVVTQARPGVPARVYLVCSSGLTPVERSAKVPEAGASDDSRRKIAQGLLDELQTQPSAAEREAGFTTSVRGPLLVSAPRKGDPSGTLRINRQPEDLPAVALAQIVCTLAESGATDGAVVLGGPGDYRARGYTCDQETKTHPDSDVPTTGPIAAPADGRPGQRDDGEWLVARSPDASPE